MKLDLPEIPKSPEDDELVVTVIFSYDRHYPKKFRKVSPEEYRFLEEITERYYLWDSIRNFDEVRDWVDNLLEEDRRKVESPPEYVAYI